MTAPQLTESLSDRLTALKSPIPDGLIRRARTGAEAFRPPVVKTAASKDERIEATNTPARLTTFAPAADRPHHRALNRFAGTVGIAVVAGAVATFGLELSGHVHSTAPGGKSGAPSPAACNGSAAVSGLGTVASTNTVSATNELVFSPASLTTQVGAVVEFKNTGTVAHTVTFQDANDGCLSDAVLDPGATWEVKFSAAGTYNYLCTIHAPSMKGEITVSGS